MVVFAPSVPAAPAGDSLRDKIRRRKVTKVVSRSECFQSKSKFIENKTEVCFSFLFLSDRLTCEAPSVRPDVLHLSPLQIS